MNTEADIVERVAKAMAAADSGPEGSTLFEIHMREFGIGYYAAAPMNTTAQLYKSRFWYKPSHEVYTLALLE